MAVRVYTPIDNPFADIHHFTQWDYCDWPAGLTLDEMFPGTPVSATTYSGAIPLDLQHLIRWQDGAVIYVRPMPQATVAAGAAIAGATAGWSAAGAGIGIGIGVGLGAAALSLGSTLLSQSKLDDKGAAEGADDRDNSITGISNQVARFEPIPRVLGRMRFYPPIPMTAQSYTEIDGDDEFLLSYFVVGYGPLEIGGKKVGKGHDKITEETDLEDDEELDQAPVRISDTDIQEYDDLEFEIGTPDQITLYADQVEQEDIGWTTDGKEDDGESTVRTTAPNITEFSLDISGPLYSHKSSKGQLRIGTVYFEVAWRKSGSDDEWETHEFYAQGKGNMIRTGAHIKDLDPGQYDVRLTRKKTTYKHGDPTKSEMTWNALRSIRERKPFDVDGVVVMALRIRGTDQLNGQIDKLNILATSVLPVYDEDEDEWNMETTRAPAWAFASVLTDKANYRPSEMDILYAPSLVEWAKETDDKGVYYDVVLDNDESTLDRLNHIADAGYATWSIDSDTRIRAVLDRISETPHDLITPRNSWDYSTTLKSFDPPDALRVRYTDTETWKRTERLVFWNGFDEDNAEVYQSLDAPGCTSREQAWIYGRRYLGNMRLRAIQKHTYKTNFRHFDYAVGDTVHIAHDVIMTGLSWGRIVDWKTSGDNVTEVTTDEFLDMFDGDEKYAIQIQNLDGEVKTVTVKNDSPGSHTARLSEDLDEKYIEKDALVAFGVKGKVTTPVKVVSITPEDQDTAEVECEPAAPEMEGVTEGDIPAPRNDTTVRPDPANTDPNAPVISRAESDSTVAHENDDGSLDWRLVVFVAETSGPTRTKRINVQVRQIEDEDGKLDEPGKWRERTANHGEAEFDHVYPGDVVEIRAEAEGDNGRRSKWSSTIEHTIQGRNPPMPESVDVERGTFEVKLIPRGNYPGLEYEFYRSEQELDLNDAADDGIFLGRGGSYNDDGLMPDSTYYYYICSVNTYARSDFIAKKIKTKNEPEAIIKNLSKQIDDSLLADELRKEIDKISGDGGDSVNERIKDEADELRDDIDDSADKLEGEIKDRVRDLRDQMDSLSSQVGDLINTPEWDEDSDYPEDSLVKHEDKLYRAKKDVPEGTDIGDDEYWEKVGDYKSVGEQLNATIATMNDLKDRVKETEDGVESIGEETKSLQSRVNALRMEGRYGFETGSKGERGAPAGWDLDANDNQKVGYVKAWDGSDYGSELAFGAKSGSPGAWDIARTYAVKKSGCKFKTKVRTKVIEGHAYVMLVCYDKTGKELETKTSSEKSSDFDGDIEVEMTTPDHTRYIELFLRASEKED